MPSLGAVGPLLNDLIDRQLIKRIWQKDTTAFAPVTAPPALHQAIEQRLGWLDAPAGMRDAIPDIDRLVADLRRDHITDVYLLGMGGSSLCAEVLRDVPLARTDPLNLVVLDTTDERAIRAVTLLGPQHSAFIVASKSDRFIEVASLEQHFWSVMTYDGKRPGAPLPSRTPTRRWVSWPINADTGAPSSTRRTSAAGTPHCRCSGWCPRR